MCKYLPTAAPKARRISGNNSNYIMVSVNYLSSHRKGLKSLIEQRRKRTRQLVHAKSGRHQNSIFRTLRI
ncbi:hypothetical protein B0T26DRAFT_704718 [Lasiosphaeria miniovina]|uniref:Uncharacterized protein n=1 Tax=Lasiosphaeria miniovina TaxID=1954250 RepID=A0AA40E583_9PEZI|nr:uncharacterized protein B0T26DRAFT_704718 [Lasiosphaeria miniovina]KAK0722943.1 hypothetical protein B0T26DRAFT_704718 [Lasiosphaeria miniovina]